MSMSWGGGGGGGAGIIEFVLGEGGEVLNEHVLGGIVQSVPGGGGGGGGELLISSWGCRGVK